MMIFLSVVGGWYLAVYLFARLAPKRFAQFCDYVSDDESSWNNDAEFFSRRELMVMWVLSPVVVIMLMATVPIRLSSKMKSVVNWDRVASVLFPRFR